jgi:uncharacterized protein (DUF1800 family)
VSTRLQRSVLNTLLVLGLVTPAFGSTTTADPKVLHYINRLSFGPTPGEVQRVQAMGIERYIQEQLSPESIPQPSAITRQLASFQTLNMTPNALFETYGPSKELKQMLFNQFGNKRNFQNPSPILQKPELTEEQKAAIQAQRRRARIITEEATTARLIRAVESPSQLQEVMTDFWFNHFNVYSGKGLDRLWVGAYEQQAIRPYALGHFRDLVMFTARHPAMLFYLDNWQNTGANTPGAQGRFKGLNENFARELMELHTLGVDGGYTQKDVTELARVLTGWGFCRNGRRGLNYDFCFDASRHDLGNKLFLGQTIKGGGAEEGTQAIAILVHSPVTARHISYELAQYFVADNPPQSLVDKLTKRYLETDGDIRAMLNTLFHSNEFQDPKYYGAKFKSPYQYLVSSLRVSGQPVRNPLLFAAQLNQFGMPLYGCQTPNGYQNTESAWLSPDALSRRISFATTLASGKLSLLPKSPLISPQAEDGLLMPPETSLTQVPSFSGQPLDPAQLADTLGNHFSPKTSAALAKTTPDLRSALILASPEMMHY